ncbi:hypothetical protein TRFO_32838 [Tritrichomonas foetus]|uniref:Fungal lipase-type domain-containing protein n=1 Tax=Tritrichomonas foetus TaxID=1144522 RepID=A0A1J4JP16_9EUKA|nr:hypothetical protein TRFO_32838 [Tritrichomonas foetus]|eukprot:OHT00474.1 hypothetical protein TRFO_32838 [Tritrichomonas foetus]
MYLPSSVMLQLTIALIHCGYKNNFTNYTGILLHSCMDVSIYHPAYFVYFYNDELFIITRGSKVNDDYATAAIFSEITDEDNRTYHTGYYKAALYVWTNVKQYIDCMGPSRKVNFIGHSYGGAVSQILHIFAVNQYAGLRDKSVFSSYCFAAPPTMGVGNESQIIESTFNIVNDDDIVPTLSVPNCLEKFRIIAPVLNLISTETLTVAVRDLLKVINITSLMDQDLFNMIYNAAPTVINAVKECESGVPKLVRYTSGNVFQLKKDHPKKLSQALIDPTETLYELSIALNCIAHHKSERYQEICDEIIPENFI